MIKESEYFKALSDPIRLRLVVLIAWAGEVCVCKLSQALEEPDFKISRHLKVLRSAGIVTARREGTWMHYSLTEPRHSLESCMQECFRECLNDNETVKADRERFENSVASTKKNVLFLCTGNSCRSQMAEGWARYLLGDNIEAWSAGTEKHGLNPRAVKVMAEAGVDISHHHSKTLDELSETPFNLVVTVCDRAAGSCPVFPGGADRILHIPFDDPPALAENLRDEQEILDCYRRIRNEIRDFVALTLLKELDKGGETC